MSDQLERYQHIDMSQTNGQQNHAIFDRFYGRVIHEFKSKQTAENWIKNYQERVEMSVRPTVVAK